MFVSVLSPDSPRNIEDGQRLLSDEVHLGNSNNSWVWYYDLSMILCLGGCYTHSVVRGKNYTATQGVARDGLRDHTKDRPPKCDPDGLSCVR